MTTTYILNRSPTKRLKDVTPEEAWTGHKPNVEHLRIFGSVCYKHVPNQLRKKLEDKGMSFVMIGYHPTGGYKLFDLKTGKATVSRDVVVDETAIADASESQHEESRIFIDEVVDPERKYDSDESDTSVRRSSRDSQLPSRLRDYDLSYEAITIAEGNFVHYALIVEVEPINFEQVVGDKKWRKAMEEEIDSIERNQTWELTELPVGKKPITLKWVYKSKINPQGEVVKHKARLMAKGFLQQAGIDYGEVFALVARIETIRLVISIAAQFRWTLHLM